MQSQVLWYTKQKGEVKGPFPVSVISQGVLIGRLKASDEVSPDKETWQLISSVDELTPDVMKADLSEPFNRERLEAARRWADERLAIDRRHLDDTLSTQKRRSDERRSIEEADVIQHREIKTERVLKVRNTVPLRKQWRLIAVIVFGFSCLFALAFNIGPISQQSEMECDAPPSPKINWSNCKFQGGQFDDVILEEANLRNVDISGGSLVRANLNKADIAFSNLSLINLQQARMQGTILTGANLQGADLRGADLRGADMSYVDLWRADLRGANLEGTNLENAIWVNKMPCGPGSLGGCVVTRAKQ